MLINEGKFSRKGKIALPLSLITVLVLTVMLVWATVPDFDNDGLMDNEEILYGTFGYGLSDNDHKNPANELDDWIDSDHDGVYDPADHDVDGDMIKDVDEVRPYWAPSQIDVEGETALGIDGRINPYMQTNPMSFDSDGDSRIESYTANVGQRVVNVAAGVDSGMVSSLQTWVDDIYDGDNGCYIGRSFTTSLLVFGESWEWDADGDGLVDAQDIDSDNDGIPDSYIDVNKDGDYDRGIDIPGEDIPNLDIDDDDCDEINRNQSCYQCGNNQLNNQNQADTDYETSVAGMEIGEGWEFADGIWDPDGMDNNFANAADNETNALNADTDFDGLGDKWEIAWSTDPNDADTDDDGLVDGWVNWNALIETQNNNGVLVFDDDEQPGEYILGTDPLDPDTDGDGLSDGVEVGLAEGQMGDFTIGDMAYSRIQFPGTRTAADYPSVNLTPRHHGEGVSGSVTIEVDFQASLGNGNRSIYVYDQCVDSTTDPLNKDSDYDGLPDGWINGWGNYFWRDDYENLTPDAQGSDVDVDLGEGEDINSNGCWDGMILGPGETFYLAYWSDGDDGEQDQNDMTMDNDDNWNGTFQTVPSVSELTGTVGHDNDPIYETDATVYDTDNDGLSDGIEILTDRWMGDDDYDHDVARDRSGEDNREDYHNDWKTGYGVGFENLYAWYSTTQRGNHDQTYNWSFSAESDRPGAGGAGAAFISSMRDRTDPLKPDSDEDSIWDGREVNRYDPQDVCATVVWGYTTNPLFSNSDAPPLGNYDNIFETGANWPDKDLDEAIFRENGYTRTWIGAPYLWWVDDIRDDNGDGCNEIGDDLDEGCNDYPVPNWNYINTVRNANGGTMIAGVNDGGLYFPNNEYRYRTDIDDINYGSGPTDHMARASNDMRGDILGFYDYQRDAEDPFWAVWRPSNAYETPYNDADLDGMVDALDPNTFYNDQDQDGLPDLFEDPDMDGVDVPCGSLGDANNDCIDDDKIWMPGENWLETSKWDGDTDDDGLWDGDEIFPGRVELDGIPNYNLYVSDPLDRDTDNDGVVDGYNNGGSHIYLIGTNTYGNNYGPYNPYDPRTFNDGAWPGNANIKDFVNRWIFNTGRNTPAPDMDCAFYNTDTDIPGELVATIDYYWDGECCERVWHDGQVPFVPGDPLFKAYYTATDPNNPDTDGDLIADGWVPVYNAADILLNHDYEENERNQGHGSNNATDAWDSYDDAFFTYYDPNTGTHVTDAVAGNNPNIEPWHYYYGERDNQMTWDASENDYHPTNLGERYDLSSDWLLNASGSAGTHQSYTGGYSYNDGAVIDYSNTRFSERYYQPPVDWGYFRVSYYFGSDNSYDRADDRYYEYMLYGLDGIVLNIDPTDDNDTGGMYEGWGRPQTATNDAEGTAYTEGNNDGDLMINALDRDADDDEVFDIAERRGQKFDWEAGQFFDAPLHPSNPGNHNSDFKVFQTRAEAGDFTEYLANNSHPMLQWDDEDATPVYDDEDGDGIQNAIEFAIGIDYSLWDSDGDCLSDFHEVNDFIFRAPGDPMLPSSGGQWSGIGTNPIRPDSDEDGLGDSYEWGLVSVDPDGMGDCPGEYNSPEDIYAGVGFSYSSYLGACHNNGWGFMVTFLQSNANAVDSDLDDLPDGPVDTDYHTPATAGNDSEYGLGTEPRNPDTDGDLLLDYEDEFSTHPYANNALTIVDSDNDMLGDWLEVMWYTDPYNPDTDFDGLLDGQELSLNCAADRTPDGFYKHALTGHRTEPTLWDTDGDGIPDGWTNRDWLGHELDYWTGEDRDLDGMVAGDDGDFLPDFVGEWTETNPLWRDSDGERFGYKDGLVDGYEENPNLRGADAMAGVNNPPYEPLLQETDPLSLDSDMDYLADDLERGLGTFFPYTNMSYFDHGEFAYGPWADMYDPARGTYEIGGDAVNYLYNDSDRDDDGIVDGHEYWEYVVVWNVGFVANPNSEGGGDLTMGTHFDPAVPYAATMPAHDFLMLPETVSLRYNNQTDEDNVEVGTNPYDWDTDKDGLFDGLEIGLAASQTTYPTEAGTWQLPGWTSWDTAPATQTDPFDYDSDNDFLADGWLDTDGDAAQYPGWAEPNDNNERRGEDGYSITGLGVPVAGIYNGAIAGDTDGDGWWDAGETFRATNPMDADTDDDGLMDGFEDTDADRWFGWADVAGATDVNNPNYGPTARPNHSDYWNAAARTVNGLYVGSGHFWENSPLRPTTDYDGLTDGTELGFIYSDFGYSTGDYQAQEQYGITGPMAVYSHFDYTHTGDYNDLNDYTEDLEDAHATAQTGHWDVTNQIVYGATGTRGFTAWVGHESLIKVKRDLDPFSTLDTDVGNYDHDQYILYRGSDYRNWVEDAGVSTFTYSLVEDTDEDGIYDGGRLNHAGIHPPNTSYGEDAGGDYAHGSKDDITGFDLYGNGMREGNNPYDQSSDWVGLGSNGAETDPTVCYAYGTSPRAWFGPHFDGSEVYDWSGPRQNLYNPFGTTGLSHREERFNPRALRMGYDTDGGDNGSAFFNNLTGSSATQGGTDAFLAQTSLGDFLGAAFNGPMAGFIVDYADQLIMLGAPLPTGVANRPMLSLWTNDGIEIVSTVDPLNPWGGQTSNGTVAWADQDIDIIDFFSTEDVRGGHTYWNGVPEGDNPYFANGVNQPVTDIRWLLDVGDDHLYNAYANQRTERPYELILDDDNNIAYPMGMIHYNIEGEYDPPAPGVEDNFYNQGTVEEGRTLEPGDRSELGKFRTYYTDWNSDPNGQNVLYGVGDHSVWNIAQGILDIQNTYHDGPVYPFPGGLFDDGFTASYLPGPADVRYQATGLRWIKPNPGTFIDYGRHMFDYATGTMADEVHFPNMKIGFPDVEDNNTMNNELNVHMNDVMVPNISRDVDPNAELFNYYDNWVQAGPFPANEPTSADADREWHGGTYTGELYSIESNGFAYDNFVLTFHVKEYLPDLDIKNDSEGQGLSNNIMTINLEGDTTPPDAQRTFVLGVPNTIDMNEDDFDSYDGPATVGIQQVSIFDPDSSYAIYTRTSVYPNPWDADADVMARAWDPIVPIQDSDTIEDLNCQDYACLELYRFPETGGDTPIDTQNPITAYVTGYPTVLPGGANTRSYLVTVDSEDVQGAQPGVYLPWHEHSPFDLAPDAFPEFEDLEPTGHVFIVARGDDVSGPMAFNPYEPITELCIDWFRLEVRVNAPQLDIDYGPVTITNVNCVSASISWTTEPDDPAYESNGSTGYVNWGVSPSGLVNTAYDDRGVGFTGQTHHVTLDNLNPGTTYYFEVVSDVDPDNNGGFYYQFTTLNDCPTITDPLIVSGCIAGVDNDAVLYVFTPDMIPPGWTQPNLYDLSALAEDMDPATDMSDGSFTINIGGYGFASGDIVLFYVDAGPYLGVGFVAVPWDDIVAGTVAGVFDLTAYNNGCIELNNGTVLPLPSQGYALWTPPVPVGSDGGDADQEYTTQFFLPNMMDDQYGIYGVLEPHDGSSADIPNTFSSFAQGGLGFAWPETHSGGGSGNTGGTGIMLEDATGYLYEAGPSNSYANRFLIFTNFNEYMTPPDVDFVVNDNDATTRNYNAVGFPASEGFKLYDLIPSNDTGGVTVGSAISGGVDTASRVVYDYNVPTQGWRQVIYNPNVGQIGFNYPAYPERGYIFGTASTADYGYSPLAEPPAAALNVTSNDEETEQSTARSNLVMAEIMSDVYVTDITSSAATLTWFTDGLATTVVRYGETEDMEHNVAIQGHDTMHRVELAGLEPNTTYYCQAISNGKQSDVHAFTTANIGIGNPTTVWGTAVDMPGEAIPNALVLATVENAGFVSQPISAITDADGNYLLNLGNLKTAAGYPMSYGPDDVLHIQVIGGLEYESTEQFLSVSGDDIQDVGLVRLAEATDDVKATTSMVPTSYSLRQNYPNPFNPATTIAYQLPAVGKVTLKVYNSVGQLVKTLVNEEQQPDRYEVRWDGKNASGESVSSGIYFYRMTVNGFDQTNKMILLK